jgi:membrane-associated phospholipid phosphatase
LTQLLHACRAMIDWLWSPQPVIAFQTLFGSAWAGPFQALSLLGDLQNALIATAVVFWLHGRRPAYAMLGVVAVGITISSLIWIPLDLARPHHPSIVVREDVPGASFPSGHTITATVLWGSLASFGWLSKILAAVVVAAVMVSRLYLGVHFVGDVLASPLIGLAVLFAFLHLWPGLWRRLAGSSIGWLPVLVILGIVALTSSVVAFFVIPPDRWGLLGGIMGAAVGLPLEYRLVRLAPAPIAQRGQRLKSVGGGRRGRGQPMLVGLMVIDELPLLSAALISFAALWGLLIAPALFVRSGLAKHR